MNVVSSLDLPHHDGSSLYVEDAHPSIGDQVRVRLRVPHPPDGQPEITQVHVRTTQDAEPCFVAAVPTRRTDSDTWWVATLPVVNPITHYRFLLHGGPWGYAWVNGTGIHVRDVPDIADFRVVATEAPPDWARESVVYQIFPDRYARSPAAALREPPSWADPADWADPVSAGERASAQFFGGDLDGITAHLADVLDLGATVLYLTPFFPATSSHRYDATSFDTVDPLLGGPEALIRLTRAAHDRGLRVIGDLTTNHTGYRHDWFRAAQEGPDSPEHGFYRFDPQGSPVCWLGVPSLPKLDHGSPELARRFFGPDGVVQRWLRPPYDLDGWRVDVANMTGRLGVEDRYDQVQRQMRAAVRAARPDGLLIAEHCHDLAGDLSGEGWHGAMNYSGFTRPLWTWLRAPQEAPSFLGLPVSVPRLGGEQVVATMADFGAQLPWAARSVSFNLAGSHDTTRIHTLVGGDPSLVEVALGLVVTMPGVPMVTYGDEIGMPGRFGEDGRRPMPWDRSELWSGALREAFRSLIAARRSSEALCVGGLRLVRVEDDALVFLRESRSECVLVHCARAGHPPLEVPVHRLPGLDGGRALHGRGPVWDGGRAFFTAEGPEVGLWAWAVSDPWC
ncbi:alpha-glucosidase [Austwickia chelonae]|uniref:Putative glycosidase n=1 Tax=Austwickia chelonae NBRC 105200 TaxID=1184607 RepID=K6W7T8_9MICO|nr:glycoside hydrolase family 13 protein [Austwickia chelonae]GAB77897.1 putative glycosidase [Austwickia chelonae NBRC 105200]SEV91755.1 alpha-glucosidase [Austwickia chelonae]